MSDYAHPADFVCPEGPTSECTGCGARDCPYGEPLHYHHDGCPACYRAFQAQHAADADAENKKTEEQNKKGREQKAAEEAAKNGDDQLDGLEAEVFTLRLGAQIADPADLATLEPEYGLRPGARKVYPGSGAAEADEWTEPDTPLVLALVQQYQDETLDLQNFVYALSGVEWGVCEWGSCQYATALAMFRALQRLKRAGLDPTETMGWGKVSELTKDAIPVAEALDKIATAMVAEIHERAEDDGDAPDDVELLTADSLRECATLDQAFDLMRQRSWDLWNAASHTGQLVFKTTFSDVEANVEASPGVGPSLNILVQSDNYTTALRCYLLLEVGYVADPDTAFADFDT